ncbi:MAG: DUF983 domain-containing protein [Gemmatimonadetes bacterium]|nr:DUF983 domain-containing protein [Gemmatimonadota bacterium]
MASAPITAADVRTTSLAARMLARALTLRCPACGGNGTFARWFTLAESCPHCGLRLHHGPHDHFVGTTLVNFLVAEMTWAFGFATYLVLSWPNPAWDALTWVSVVFMAVLPVTMYPFTRITWLAVDLFFRPGGEGERKDTTPIAP